MYIFWIAISLFSVSTFYLVSDLSHKEEILSSVSADVAATSVLAYREAVQQYAKANPQITGNIPAVNIGSFFPAGFVSKGDWRAAVNGTSVYVYKVQQDSPAILSALHRKAPDSLLFGLKDSKTGTLRSYKGLDTGIVLPASIPSGAVVVVGGRA